MLSDVMINMTAGMILGMPVCPIMMKAIKNARQTGSQWDFEGKSTEGPLKGKQLLRLPFDEGYWFEWVAFHPGTKVY